MDDWRLNGQEEYLSNKTLHKVKFPEFWKESYLEKNGFYQEVSAQALNHTELFPDMKDWLEGEKIQHLWHDHCEFCWDKVTTDTECEFYSTEDWHHWICKECFNDFKDKFHWTVKQIEK